MSESILLLPHTIQAIKDRIDALYNRFQGLSTTSVSERFLNPEKVSAYEELCQLESLIKKVKPIVLPKYSHAVQMGSLIITSVSGPGVTPNDVSFQLSSTLDVKYAETGYKGARLLSVDSPLGRLLFNKKQGDHVLFKNRTFLIKSIEAPSYI